MAILDTGFNADSVDTSSRFEALPPGNYEVVVTDSEIRPTKAKTGKILVLTMEIIRGTCKGKKLWANVNIINPSVVAQEIAQKFLARLCKAVGVKALKDTEALHNKPFVVKVKLDKDDKDRNVVADVVLDDSAASVRTARPAAVAPAPAPKPAGSGPAWQRKKPAPVDAEVVEDVDKDLPF